MVKSSRKSSGCFTYLGLAFLSVLRSQSVQQERSVTRDGREAEHGGRAIRNRTVLRFGLPALSRGDSILLVPCVRTYVARPTIIKKYDDCRLLPFTVVRFCLVQAPSPSPHTFPPALLVFPCDPPTLLTILSDFKLMRVSNE